MKSSSSFTNLVPELENLVPRSEGGGENRTNDASTNAKFDFEGIFPQELADVNARRRKQDSSELDFDENAQAPTTELGLVGLALSGGGIRSAAFSLGALQALDAKGDLIKRIDYLSTVSGGGYIGSSLTVGLTKSAGHFPFRSELGKEENDCIKHIRDFSNYLLASGPVSVVQSIGAIAAGLVANSLIVAWILLLIAGFTIVLNPTWDDLATPFGGFGLINFLDLSGRFSVTLNLALISAVLMVALVLVASDQAMLGSHFRKSFRGLFGILFILPLVVGLIEFQPVAIEAQWRLLDNIRDDKNSWKSVFENLTSILAAIGRCPQHLSRLLETLVVGFARKGGLSNGGWRGACH